MCLPLLLLALRRRGEVFLLAPLAAEKAGLEITITELISNGVFYFQEVLQINIDTDRYKKVEQGFRETMLENGHPEQQSRSLNPRRSPLAARRYSLRSWPSNSERIRQSTGQAHARP